MNPKTNAPLPENKKSDNHNYLLEFWRFAFCTTVLLIHYLSKAGIGIFRAAYLSVDFFFLVSGYFVGCFYFKHSEGKNLQDKAKAVQTYISTRLKRLYPMYLAALFLMLIIRSAANHLNLRGIFSMIKSCFAEFFLLQWFLGEEVLVYSDWYVPAVFWGGIFLILLLLLTGKIGGFFLVPVISFFIYRYYFLLIGKIDVIVTHHGVLRGIAGMGVGVFVCFLCKTIPELPQKLSVGLLIFANLALTGLYVYIIFGHHSKWDFPIIALEGLCLFILMKTDFTIKNDKIKNALSFMGKCTYPIYIFQLPVLEGIVLILQLIYP